MFPKNYDSKRERGEGEGEGEGIEREDSDNLLIKIINITIIVRD